MKRHCCICLLVLAAALQHGDALSVTDKNPQDVEEVALISEPALSKRQTDFQNSNFDQQQIPQEYFDFIQQTDSLPQSGQLQNNAQRPAFIQGLTPGVLPPTTTTTQSPFTIQQKRFQEEYARRTLVEQQTALLRARQRQSVQPLPGTQFAAQASSTTPRPQQLPLASQPLRFVDTDGQVRQQNPVPRQQDFVVQQQQDFVAQQQQDFVAQQQQDFVAQQQQQQQQDFVTQQEQDFAVTQQQDFAVPTGQVFGEAQQQQFAAPQRQVLTELQQQGLAAPRPTKNAVPAVGNEPFSYSEVHFGPAPERTEPVVVASRPKGQRSVSRPRANQVLPEQISQQTVDRPATVVNPAAQFNTRLLQNAVYVQPNGQIYKPVEETEPVVQIPRQSHHLQQIVSGPAISASSTTVATSPAEEEPVIVIPRPKKPVANQQRPRHEGRKAGSRAQQRPIEVADRPLQQQQYQNQLHQQHQQHQQNQQNQQQQQSSEVEQDNFLSSLLGRLQQQQLEHQQQLELQQQLDQQQQLEQQQHFEQQQTVKVATTPKTDVSSSSTNNQRPKGGSRTAGSKYLADKNQLQLLQFPHELKSLSSAELRVLEQASAQIAVANDKSVEQRKHLHRTSGRPATTVLPPQPAEFDERLQSHNRPVPTPVELNEQQRQFLAAQGIRHLYRVDYDQAGNELPLTYVLALDNNRAKHQPQPQQQ